MRSIKLLLRMDGWLLFYVTFSNISDIKNWDIVDLLPSSHAM